MPRSILPLEIIRRADEPKAKCTAMLLAHHPTVRLFHFPHLEDFDPVGKWVLAIGGEPLDLALRGAQSCGSLPAGVVLVDTIWRKADRVLALIPPMRRVTIPPGWQSAYPRRSKITPDPGGGLATNEAAFVARLIAGCEDRSLLTGYRWSEEFLFRNSELIADSSTRAAQLQLPAGCW